MKAIVFDEFGGPEVLHEEEVELPNPPGPGRVRIKVRAAGVNPMDFKIRSGMMPGMPAKFPSVPGIEAAGIVDAVGEDVTSVKVGDEVFGWTIGGAYREYATLTMFAVKPALVSFVDAVALPVAGETAERVLGMLDVKPGETLLVHGAAGAVGTIAVQLAAARGARVIGTAGASNQDHVRSLGAIPTLYGEGLVDRVRALAPDGVDAVFDVAGHDALPDSIELRGGTTERIVTIADAQNAAKLGVPFTGGPGSSVATPELIADLADRLARGELKVEIAGAYPLSEAAEAQRVSEAGHVRGKLVLTVG